MKILLDKEETLKPFIECTSEENIHASPGKETYQIVKVLFNGENYAFKPLYGKSGLVSQMLQADGYIIIDSDREGIARGEKMKVYLFE